MQEAGKRYPISEWSYQTPRTSDLTFLSCASSATGSPSKI